MYFTASIPNVPFATFQCDRYQANTMASYLTVTKQILIYLMGTKSLGLWYPIGNDLCIQAFADFDHVGCKIDRNSTSVRCQFLGG